MTTAELNTRRRIVLEFIAWLSEKPGGFRALERSATSDELLVDSFLKAQRREEDKAA